MPTPHDPVARTPQGDLDPSLPEVVRRFLLAGATLEDIRLDPHGRWWHEGEPFQHKRLADLFSRSLHRTPGGTWVLQISGYTYPVTVEDTGRFVLAFDLPATPQDPITLHLSSGTSEPLDLATLRHDLRGLTCLLRDPPLRARFAKPAYYALAEHITETPDGFALRLHDALHPIPPADATPP
jgi:hypothetical protein